MSRSLLDVLQGRLHEAMRTAVAVEDPDDGVNHARGQTVRRGCPLMRALNQLRNPFKGTDRQVHFQAHTQGHELLA